MDTLESGIKLPLVAKNSSGSKITQPSKRCHIGSGERRGKASIEFLMVSNLHFMNHSEDVVIGAVLADRRRFSLSPPQQHRKPAFPSDYRPADPGDAAPRQVAETSVRAPN